MFLSTIERLTMLTNETIKRLRSSALEILTSNDRGNYTVPTAGLYPFQWNWDSCLTAIGMSNVDENRAFVEIETLFAHQWPDGMVPHIIFHEHDPGYFPGPEVWETKRPTPTSGITQPAVAGFALQKLYERSVSRDALQPRVKVLVQAVDRWHQWFYEHRDPQDEGLVAVLHPWETGRDNSVDWDSAFERVPTDGVGSYQRRDLDHADAGMRPTGDQYDRYLWLVQHFRRLGWGSRALHDSSPFRIVDPGFNAILIRACEALADVADAVGEGAIAQRNRARATLGRAALQSLWSDRHGQYVCFDRADSSLVDSASIGGILPIFALDDGDKAAKLAQRMESLCERCRYWLPSHDPDDGRFDSQRYWRGPVWLIVNYMLVDGLGRHGHEELARRLRDSSLALIDRFGMAEYFDPITGAACGGKNFTWTAAMVLEFLRED